jgi:cytochrome c553
MTVPARRAADEVTAYRGVAAAILHWRDRLTPLGPLRDASAAVIIAIAAALAPVSTSAATAEASAGKAKAQPCAVCHGPVGVSSAPDAPNLAGQPAMYLSAQLRAFRSGDRRHEVMNVIAKPLTDSDIDALAAWFSSIRIDVTPP